MNESSETKLNLGCGDDVISEWLNVDYSIGARIIRLKFLKYLNERLNIFRLNWSDEIFLHDLRKKFPWEDSSINVIYSSHTLEHLSKKEGALFISECFRVLKPGGLIRIIVPSLDTVIAAYQTGNLNALDFVDKLGVLYSDRGSKIKNIIGRFVEFPHKCMYSESSLIEAMNNAGFISSSRLPFDSEIPNISRIEKQNRTENAVIVEATKP